MKFGIRERIACFMLALSMTTIVYGQVSQIKGV